MQFAYCKGTPTELAAHYLVSHLEKAKLQKQIAMTSFMDIQGAFDNTIFESRDATMLNKEITPPIRRWINTMLTSREIHGNSLAFSHRRAPSHP